MLFWKLPVVCRRLCRCFVFNFFLIFCLKSVLMFCVPACSKCVFFCVQVWELSSGELLLSVLFDVEIMSVTSDPSEYFLFCGGSDGNIFQVSLCSQVSPTVLKLHNPLFNKRKSI